MYKSLLIFLVLCTVIYCQPRYLKVRLNSGALIQSKISDIQNISFEGSSYNDKLMKFNMKTGNTEQFMLKNISSLFFDSIFVSVKDDGISQKTFIVNQNYPNPFNLSTIIEYQIPATGMVTIKVFDIQGKEVKSIKNEIQQAGNYRIEWTGTNELNARVSNGVYVARVSYEKSEKNIKMLVIK